MSKTDFDKVLKEVEKDTGMKIQFMNDEIKSNISVIPTPSWILNKKLGCGGLPRGRIVEIFGPESGGKTTISLLMIAAAQKMGLRGLYVDAEQGFEKEFAESLGVDVNELAYASPDYAEQMFDSLEKYLEKNLFGIVVVDSVTALLPKEEFETNIEKHHYAPLAKLLSKAMRRLAIKISRSNTLVIFINQLREKIGVVYGNPESTPGGRALKFYSSVRLRVDVNKKEFKKDDKGTIIGHRNKVKVKKNKVGPPLAEVEFDLYYGVGVDNDEELFELALLEEVIIKEGNTYYLNDITKKKEELEKIAVGKDASKSEIVSNKKLKSRIMKLLNIKE